MSSVTQADCRELTELIRRCEPLLKALGDENRQHILLQMLEAPGCSGMRIGDIARISSLSRAAASRHMQVLRQAGLLKVRTEGTRHYYSFTDNARVFEDLKRLTDIGTGW